VAPRAERYPEIGSYAIVGDSRACALVSLDGSVDWMCLPRFDSPSVFGRLLDWDRGGYFRIAPVGPYTVRRRYVDATNVLETTFMTADGEVSVLDFMPAQGERRKRRALAPLRMLIRLVQGRRGTVRMCLEYSPRPDYGGGGIGLRLHGPTEITASRGRHATHLRSDVPVDVTGADARAEFDVAAGDRLRFPMSYSLSEPAVLVSDVYIDILERDTLAFWRDWSSQVTYDGPWRAQVLRSALTLKLLAYAPSGAIAAAATTSLPEEIGGVRNWDYRFCWIRDAAFTVKTFLSLGLEAEATAFVGWLMHATRQTAPRLRPLYTLHGEPHVPERELAHLEGYRASRPVRIGNAAAAQGQFDVYGELVDAFDAYIQDQDADVGSDEERFIAGIADYVAAHWRQPDSGIWEARAAPRQYTHSKVMAWDALVHAARLAEQGRIRGDSRRWRGEADAVRAEVLERGYNARIGSFTQVLGGEALDASTLAIALVGFLPGDDPRVRSTIDAVRRKLDHHGFLLRYRDVDDGLPGEEGTFLVCNFWLACALAQSGEVDDAREVFERTLAAANDVGVLSEQWDPLARRALGNTPQGLSHLGLITAALAIRNAESGAPEERRRWPSAK